MKFIKRLLILAIFCLIAGLGTILGFYIYLKPELPDVASLKDVELQTPMRIYSADGKLISLFGEKQRIPVRFEEIPGPLIDALIATEDSRFYEHPGVDPIGITRALAVVLASGSAKQGASTITQQLARNFYLSNEKKLMRKIKEMFIALHIERLLTKEEILELYINKIFLGYRSYGFGAAARVYFDKNLSELTLGETATLAGMPKAPSTMNPLYSLSRATSRRNVVLMRMLSEQYITQEQYENARNEVLESRYHGIEIDFKAPYIAEMARAWAVEKYGEKVYESGYKVTTTIDSRLQESAQNAAINNLLNYDERHGYRGAIAKLWHNKSSTWTDEKIAKHLKSQPEYADLIPAVVIQVQDDHALVKVENNKTVSLPWDGMKWARRFKTDNIQGSPPTHPSEILAEGEQIWVRKVNDTWKLSQVPNANTALVALSPNNGAVKALVGGFDFLHSKFNRATQSIRQVGSIIKPFIYSTGLEHGMTLATLINDAPINTWDSSQGIAWRPKNSPPTYDGPTRARLGLAQSKNVMAVRVLRRVGLDETINYLSRFGFKPHELPRAEPLALGAGNLTPMEMVQGFGVFANGGYYLEPFYIAEVEEPLGDIIYTAKNLNLCQTNCNQPDELTETTFDDPISWQETQTEPTEKKDDTSGQPKRVITEQNAFLVREMLEANIWGGGSWRDGTGWNGTGWRAQKPLNRRDIGGKTGTTNESKDAWYTGFGPGLVATVWVGFDNHARSLGQATQNKNLTDTQVFGGESGAKTAQPGWIDFMKEALENVPVERKKLPKDIVIVRIDRKSGLLTRRSDSSSRFEYFEKGTAPTEYVSSSETKDNIYELAEDELF